MQLIEIQQRFMQAGEAGGGGAGGDYEENVIKFLEKIPLKIGEAAKEKVTPQLLIYESTAVEPTVDQQYALARGETPPALLELANYERPPAVERDQHAK